MITPGPGGKVASPLNLVTASAAVALQNKLAAGDAYPDFEITGDGKIQWGQGGAVAPDTSLARTANGTLTVSGSLEVPNGTVGNVGLFNTLAANETIVATAGTNGAPPTQVVGYLTFYDHTGTARKLPYYAV